MTKTLPIKLIRTHLFVCLGREFVQKKKKKKIETEII